MSALVAIPQPVCGEDNPVLQARKPIVRLCASPAGKTLAYVMQEQGAQTLYVKTLGTPAEPELAAKEATIGEPRFLSEDRLLFVTGDTVMMYELGAGKAAAVLAQGRRPVASPASSQLLFLQGDTLWLMDLKQPQTTKLPGFSPEFAVCDWLNATEYLACKDGGLWELDLNGRAELLLKGDRYAPWYVQARVSPDGTKVLVESDDTKTDVGRGGRSLWVMDGRTNKVERLLDARTGQWLDSHRIVAAVGQKLLLVRVASAAGELPRLVFSGEGLEAFSVCGTGIAYSVRQTDEDGLPAGSAVYFVTP